jgi:DNA-binding NtrC family response regulator
VKLLRVLQERELERVGGVETVKVDVRVISATHRDLESLIAEGKFREDLYYRLNVFPITLPPLRERTSDIPLLVEHFIQKFSQSTGKPVRGAEPAAIGELRAYSWPGNVRELENVIERAMILTRGPMLSSADLDFGRRVGVGGGVAAVRPAGSAPPSSAAPAEGGESGRSFYKRISEQERNEIIAAVERAHGNIAHAARSLGINRSTLYYRMRKHDLEHLLPTREEPPAAGRESPGGADC